MKSAKNYIVYLIVFLPLFLLNAQVGIGTVTPETNLDVRDDDETLDSESGIAIPQVSAITAVDGSRSGQIVYSLADSTYFFWDGSMWVELSKGIADIRVVGFDNHISSDSGISSNGTSVAGGSNNILIGKDSGSSITTTGIGNILLGSNAGKALTTLGDYNVFLGQDAGLSAINGGDDNINIGRLSGNSLSGGVDNVNIGRNAGSSIINQSNNVNIGPDTTGSGRNNINLGLNAGASIMGGLNNVNIGVSTGMNLSNGSNNINIGSSAGFNLGTANSNINIGTSAGLNLNSGFLNINIGSRSGEDLTLGLRNINLGHSGGSNTTGDDNICIGDLAGDSIIDANNNVIIGTRAGELSTGGDNVFLGYFAGRNQNGNSNIVIGSQTDLPDLMGDNQLAIGAVINGIDVYSGTNALLGIKTNAPNSTLHVNGSMANNIITLSTGVIPDDGYTVLVSGAVTMPDPTIVTGRIYNLINADAGSHTITGNFNINGSISASFTLDTTNFNRGINVQSDGTNWVVISRH